MFVVCTLKAASNPYLAVLNYFCCKGSTFWVAGQSSGMRRYIDMSYNKARYFKGGSKRRSDNVLLAMKLLLCVV